MAKIENRLDKKVTAYIDNLFSGVGPSIFISYHGKLWQQFFLTGPHCRLSYL